MSENNIAFAVIGGSGLYGMPGLSDVTEHRISTPFGDPSDVVVVGALRGARVAFLPRHGRGHRLNPSEVPSQANIYALKSLGVKHIISVSACGSLRQDMQPRDIVVPDQLFDFTKGRRPASFFDAGIVGGSPIESETLSGDFCEQFLREKVIVPVIVDEQGSHGRVSVGRHMNMALGVAIRGVRFRFHRSATPQSRASICRVLARLQPVARM